MEGCNGKAACFAGAVTSLCGVVCFRAATPLTCTDEIESAVRAEPADVAVFSLFAACSSSPSFCLCRLLFLRAFSSRGARIASPLLSTASSLPIAKLAFCRSFTLLLVADFPFSDSTGLWSRVWWVCFICPASVRFGLRRGRGAQGLVAQHTSSQPKGALAHPDKVAHDSQRPCTNFEI